MSKRKNARTRKQGNLETNPQGRYIISPELKALLHPTETEEEVTKYFEHINYCIEVGICSDCGQGVIFMDDCRDEHMKEYSISGLCKKCQIKAFGE